MYIINNKFSRCCSSLFSSPNTKRGTVCCCCARAAPTSDKLLRVPAPEQIFPFAGGFCVLEFPGIVVSVPAVLSRGIQLGNCRNWEFSSRESVPSEECPTGHRRVQLSLVTSHFDLAISPYEIKYKYKITAGQIFGAELSTLPRKGCAGPQWKGVCQLCADPGVMVQYFGD